MDSEPLKALATCIAAGVSLFVIGFFLILVALRPDPSALQFYPLVAACGALFGFERWWTYEYGPVNPFH